MACMAEESKETKKSGDGDGLGESWHLWRRRRYVLAALAFVGLISMYSTRISFSVALVAMVSAEDPHDAADNGEFNWDSRTQGLLLSGFFYGYLLAQLPAGWIAARAGAAALLGAGVAGSALLAMLAPLAARLGGWPLLLATRAAQGLLQGAVFPCLVAIWARWAPPAERARLAAAVASGCNVGTVVSLPVSGLLATHAGWPAVFYVFGAAGVVWWVLWWAQAADSPEADRRASSKERLYIAEAIGSDTSAKVSFHPWRKIFTCPAYVGKIVAHFCCNWGFYTLVTQMPMYLKDTLGFDLRAAGFVSALPYLLMALLLPTAGTASDWLQNRQFLSTTLLRRSFLAGALSMQAACLLLSTTLTGATAVVACITLGVGLQAFAYAVICVNSLDLAPLHASVLTGVSNTIANLSGILSPQLTGFIVQNQSAAEWRIVFYVSSGILLTGAGAFAALGSAERQPWAQDGLVKDSPPRPPSPDAANSTPVSAEGPV